MWDRELHRIALLELVTTGTLRRRSEQAEAWDELAALPWTHRTTRRHELVLDESHRGTVESLLDRVWPTWRVIQAALAADNLPPTPRGLQQLDDLQRQAAMPAPLPARLNHRTATAVVAPHSKAALTEQRRQALGAVDITRDGIVRLRPHRGLALRRNDLILDLAPWTALLGEIALPERALQAGLELVGPAPALVLLVENVGPYVDLAAPPDWLVAHVPGWNTRTAELLLARLPDVPVVLFGDLDPAGVAIAAHLRESLPALRWATFDLWRTLLPMHAQARKWPEDFDLHDAPPLVQELARDGFWLEQERLVLHPELIDALTALAAAPLPDGCQTNSPPAVRPSGSPPHPI